MAIVNQVLHRKNSSGTYDTVYLQANLANVTGVLAPEHGGTGASEITDVTPVEFTPYVHPTEKQCNYSYAHPSTKQCDAAAGNHTHSDATTSAAGFMSASDKTKLNGLSNYTHPTSKQCSYSYTHPATKQCNAVIPDISNYYTRQEINSMIRPVLWTLGATIGWDNKLWLVCHIDSTGYYLIAKDIISETLFGDYPYYDNSTLASVAASYQSNNMSAAALAECVNVTVEGVTAKVFVPSKAQFEGGFSWFNSDDHRKASYNGIDKNYWTSSNYNNAKAWYVTNVGSLIYDGSYKSMGFRPCVCVQI